MDTPVLEVEKDDMVFITIGTESITETIKDLNENARNDATVSIISACIAPCTRIIRVLV